MSLDHESLFFAHCTFRSALALLKTFYKQCGQKKKGGEELEEVFKQFCSAPGVQPQELMARAFKFPRSEN